MACDSPAIGTKADEPVRNEQAARKGSNNKVVLNEAAQRLGVSLRQTEDQLMRDMLASSASFINAVGGSNGDNPSNPERSDIDSVVQSLAGQNAYTISDIIDAENKFGKQSAELKSALIDMESRQADMAQAA